MPDVRFDSWELGLWLGGQQDKVPARALRRALNIDSIYRNEVRSRYGSVRIASHNATAIFRFFDTYFYVVGKNLFRNTVQIAGSLADDRPTFNSMSPTAGKPAHLFVCGLGPNLFKVDQSGLVRTWGIQPPGDNAPFLKGTKINSQDKQLANFDGDDTTEPGNVWGTRGESNFFIFTDQNIKIEGTGSHRIQIYRHGALTGLGALFNVAGTELNLAELDDPGDPSSDEDYITLQVRIRDVDTVERIDIYMDDTPQASFEGSYYAAAITPVRLGDVTSSERPIGVADLLENESRRTLSADQAHSISRNLAPIAFPIADDVWTEIKIPKSAFIHTGSGQGWSKIEAVNILFKMTDRFVDATPDPETGLIPAGAGAFVWVDELRLEGGAGMVGTYKYLFTFKNSSTGSRSNPNATPLVVENVRRNRVQLTGIPQPLDPQVDKIEIWRTLGNGARYFKCAEVNVGTTSFLDKTSDFFGFHPIPGETALGDEELPLDNTFPQSDFWFCYGPYRARAWWLSQKPGERGLLFYSPAGRVEAVEGFIEVTDDDDPLQSIVEWNGYLYVISEAHWFQVDGDDEPFIARDVWGVPGVLNAHRLTITPSPRGILYIGDEGPRLFDGARSTLIGQDQVLPLFRGESVSDMAQFSPALAQYGRGEWILTDGVYMLAFDPELVRWREVTFSNPTIQALYFDEEIGEHLVTYAGKVVALERDGVFTDDGAAIGWGIRTPSHWIDEGDEGVVHMLFIEANCAGQILTPTLTIDGTDVALPPITGTTRQLYEFPIYRRGRRVHVTLFGTISARVSVQSITLDVRTGRGRPDQRA